MKWININDELPEQGKPVLVYKDPEFGPEMLVDYIVWTDEILPEKPKPIKNYLWACQLEDEYTKVSHWMPLPASPKEE